MKHPFLIAKISGIVPALCLFAVLGAPTAHADQITLTIGGADTGTITLTETGNDTPITGISGTFDSATIGTLISANGIGGNDNLFFTAPIYLDSNGVSFTLTGADSNGYTDVNLYYNGGGPYYQTEQGDSPGFGSQLATYYPDTATASGASGTPEPASFVLLGSALAAVGSVRRRVL